MKKKSMLIATIVMVVATIAALTMSGCSLKPPSGEAVKITEIELPTDGFVRVLQLTDLHLSKGSSKREDKETLKWVEEAINYSKPDLVAMTGDIVGGAYGRDNALIELANMMEKKEVYWMYTMGNHDGEMSVKTKENVGKRDGLEGRLEILDILKGYKYSLLTRGDTDGVGNYIINVVNGKREIVHSFINMDTHGKLYQSVDGKDVDMGYMGLKQGQVEWYAESLNRLAERTTNKAVPKSTLFMHVPLVEYRDAWLTEAHVGSYAEINLEREVFAPKEDKIGIFEIMEDIGSTMLMSVGHDHDFNWLRSYKRNQVDSNNGIYLSYGRVSGVNAFGRRAPIGATIFDINTAAVSKEAMYKISIIEPTFKYSKWEGEGKNW